MRTAVTLLAGLACVAGLLAQAPKDAKAPKLTKRYGIEADLLEYPQGTPQEALRSVFKAIDGGRIDYLAAQLADPDWVDQRVKQIHEGKFDRLVEEMRDKFANDKTSLKELRRFVEEAQWDITDTKATGQVKDVKDRVYMRKLEGRWFLETRKQGAAAKEK